MITGFSVPTWSQRDPRWANQRLGLLNPKGNNVTIGQSGCLITSIAMMNAGFDPDHQLTPNQVDDKFADGSGYASYNLVIWNAINRLLNNDATLGADYCATTPAPVAVIKSHLDAAGLVILQVGFGGNPDNMHFVLAVGYDGDDIIFNDPWYGDRSSFASRRYGAGVSSRDILAAHYFGDAVANVPVKPEVPVSSRPAVQPLLGYQREIIATANANYRKAPSTDSEVIKKFDAGLTLDFKGFIHGQNIDGNDIWFVGRYSDGYAYSGCFTDIGTHDLPDLTPQPAAPAAPAPGPAPVEVPVTPVETAPVEIPDEEDLEPVDEPVEDVDNRPEWERTWYDDLSIPRKLVAVPSADVYDFVADKVVKTLPGGELVQPLAGYFRVKGIQYVRTQVAEQNGLWNGINLAELKDYVPDPPAASILDDEPDDDTPTTPAPPVNPGAPVDGIQPPADLDEPDYELPEETEAEPARIPLDNVLTSLKNFILGILLTPLRLVGVIQKIRKGVK